jgi:hypothetical protein
VLDNAELAKANHRAAIERAEATPFMPSRHAFKQAVLPRFAQGYLAVLDISRPYVTKCRSHETVVSIDPRRAK